MYFHRSLFTRLSLSTEVTPSDRLPLPAVFCFIRWPCHCVFGPLSRESKRLLIFEQFHWTSSTTCNVRQHPMRALDTSLMVQQVTGQTHSRSVRERLTQAKEPHIMPSSTSAFGAICVLLLVGTGGSSARQDQTLISVDV